MLYRRLWLLLLVLVFLIVAPAVVFWTSGYRWNAKKGVVERNGTLIVDTQPSDARVFLNGEALSDRTPFTRQDIAPGTYRIRLEREGYHPWEKTLEVRPERVTFVTDVWLWRATEPQLFREGVIQGVAGSEDGRELALVEQVNGVPRLLILPVGGGVFGGDEATRSFQGRAPTGTVRMTWNDEGTGVLMEDDAQGVWAAGTADPTGVAALLPSGLYRWSGSTLVGIVDGARVSYALADGVVRRTVLPEGVRDEEGAFQIRMDSAGLSVVERGRDSRQFALPPGAWGFMGREDGWLFLRSAAPNARWLAFDPRADEAGTAVNLPADALPRSTRVGDETMFLTFGGGELWSVVLGKSAELLARTSDAVIGAAWHPRAPYAFYASMREVIGLGLDARDSRVQTTLALFDRISDMTLANRMLYVVGEREGRRGVWQVAVE